MFDSGGVAMQRQWLNPFTRDVFFVPDPGPAPHPHTHCSSSGGGSGGGGGSHPHTCSHTTSSAGRECGSRLHTCSHTTSGSSGGTHDCSAATSDVSAGAPAACGTAAARHLALERFQYAQDTAFNDARAAMRRAARQTLETIKDVTQDMLEYAIGSQASTERMRRIDLEAARAREARDKATIAKLQPKHRLSGMSTLSGLAKMYIKVRCVPPHHTRMRAYREKGGAAPLPAWIFDQCLEIPCEYAERVRELDALYAAAREE